MELWQTAAQQLDRLQQVYQRAIADGQTHDAQRQQLKVHNNMQSLLQHISPSDAHLLLFDHYMDPLS